MFIIFSYFIALVISSTLLLWLLCRGLDVRRAGIDTPEDIHCRDGWVEGMIILPRKHPSRGLWLSSLSHSHLIYIAVNEWDLIFYLRYFTQMNVSMAV